MGGKGVAISTDANGLLIKPCPRFGNGGGERCSQVSPHLLTEQKQVQRNGVRYAHYEHARQMRKTFTSDSLERLQVPLIALGEGTYDINTMGFAHYGMLPDFLQDVRNIGLNSTDLTPLFGSAEDYIQVWEKCEQRSKALADMSF